MKRPIRRGIVILALLAVLLGIPVVAALERGDYATAMEGFRVHAEQGNTNAQEILGFRYDYGWGVPEDDAEAVKWYRKAAEQGYGVSRIGPEPSRARSGTEAAGDPRAQYKLASMYFKGEGVPQDYR